MTQVPGLSVEHAGDVVVAALQGELDITTRHDVEWSLRTTFAAEARALVLDLTGVTFLDSRSVQMLFQLHDDLARSRRTMAIAIPPDAPPRRSIEICDPERRLDLRPTRAEALLAVAVRGACA